MVNLASGSADTWESYHGQVGYIEAMNAVLALCKEIELSMHGTMPGSEAADG
jgi:hypothetical protein